MMVAHGVKLLLCVCCCAEQIMNIFSAGKLNKTVCCKLCQYLFIYIFKPATNSFLLRFGLTT